MIKTVDTNDVLRILEDGTWKVIDIRSADAYNGWTLDNENRGGHIPGAKSLPAKWLNYIDWIEVVNKKNIKPSDKLVIYGTNQDDISRAATRFVKSGFNSVYTYSKFLEEWIMNPELPMDYLPRYQNLVPAKWVRSLISGEIPMLYNNSRYIVIHAHYRNREAYLSGHIPGAIDMDTLALEAPETWNRRD
ncbi:MAG TPA: rhodanese-like domain-containing protein, partial [Mariniphaga sp.]|nr:rhodanese-like domain-containing protein [Mariniphaga sp.]